MCFYLDLEISRSLAFVQFPQIFYNVSKNGIYDGQARSTYKIAKCCISGFSFLLGSNLSKSESVSAISTTGGATNALSSSTTDAAEPGVGGVLSRYLGITHAYLWQTQLQQAPLSMGMAEYQMPLFREIDRCLKAKCDKLADAFEIDDIDTSSGNQSSSARLPERVKLIIEEIEREEAALREDLSSVDRKFAEYYNVEAIQVNADEGGFTQTCGGIYWVIFPAGCFVGELHPDKNSDNKKHMLYTHKNIIVKYNKDEIGYSYDSLLESTFMGYLLHSKGWRSIYLYPKRPCFLGCTTIDMKDTMVQQMKWSSRLLQVGLSRFSPLTYGMSRMSMLQSMCYGNLTFTYLQSFAFLLYGTIPQLCLLNGIPLYPKISHPWFVAFASVYTSALCQHLYEVLSSGGSIGTWWNEQRIGKIKFVTACLYA
ncbi:AUGMIN subunit 4 [Camellia lanceoleosa]|uniref:AUGMIN subunit 4 n=1 Tax=Camellia lanceoleosa TaxID=1840588 RepID=A0ACC0HKD5_9ERIC|nr:AUGMIN subunit 4 [Camellia lanceoleosa]